MKQPFHIYVDQSPVGIGKTYNALSHALHYPARYLFATERRESVWEIEQRLRSMAFDRRVGLAIKTVTSSTGNRGWSVTTEVSSLPLDYANDAAHVVIIITHSALMSSDLTGFEGWHLIIDEVPNILVQQSVRTKTDYDFFDRNYTLTPINTEWAQVGLTEVGRGLTAADLSECQSHGYLRAFHQRVASGLRPVLCDIHDWADMARHDVSWTWWSLFDVGQLQAFKSIKFLGAGFMDRLAAKMLRNLDPEVTWVASSRMGDRQPMAKRVRVHYFTESFSSRYYFESDHGQDHLASVARYLHSTMPAQAIWTANDPAGRPRTAYRAMKPHMGALRYLSPRQAGTSEYMAYHDAAIIYASKPSSASKAILGALGCSEADWIETNEYETILQFLTRTSVRDVTVGGTTNLYVMSRDQADYLVRFFESQPHITVELHHIDLGLEYPDVKLGRPRVAVSPAEAAAREEAKRQAAAARQRERRARLKK